MLFICGNPNKSIMEILNLKNKTEVICRLPKLEFRKFSFQSFTLKSSLCFYFDFSFHTDFDQPDFKKSIVYPEDLRVGSILTGRVENATLFGVFVDIGVGIAGLIPIRSITEDKLSKAKKRTSLSLGPGEKVEVRVHKIDLPHSRITLELIRVL